MKSPRSMDALEKLGRVRLSKSFFMRDFLYSEIASLHGMLNVPEDPDLAIAAGARLCEDLLEPLNERFGRIHIRSAYRSPTVNAFGNANGFNCASNAANAAGHIWDLRDSEGRMGATACVVVPWFADRNENGADWRELAWWIHDHLPYHSLYFFPVRAAFNITWREAPEKRIDSYIAPRGCLTRPGFDNHSGDHSDWYRIWALPEIARRTFVRDYLEVWEKPLDFLNFDWAGVQATAEGGASVDFASCRGLIYERVAVGSLGDARALLRERFFRPFEPTPERMQFRHPYQLDHFVLGPAEPGRSQLAP